MKLLSALLFAPLCGALLLAVLPAAWQERIRQVALLFSGATLGVALLLLARFDTSLAGPQFVETSLWQERMGSYYSLGVDGISLPLVLLACLLSFVAMLASADIRDRPKGYYMAMLLLEMAMLGVFMAQDWSLFYIFWELTLLPLFFLIDRWGGQHRQHAALNFVLYTMGGSVFMLISLLISFDASHGYTFAMDEMAVGLSTLPVSSQVWIFLGFLVGFGVKMPIVPIHGWLPLAHVEAPGPVSILLSGALLKMGSYGLIRASAMLPQGMAALHNILAVLGFISLLYGAVLAWRQTDIKSMIAYSSISHMGIVLLGLSTLNQAGVTGAVTQMVAHGLAAGAMFLMAGLLYHRTHSREIADYGGLARLTPRFALFLVLAFLAATGMPATAGFIAELHAVVGAFQRWGWPVALMGLAMLIGAAYALRTIGRMLTGPPRGECLHLRDMSGSEVAAVALPVFLSLLLGLFPLPLLEIMGSSVRDFLMVFEHTG